MVEVKVGMGDITQVDCNAIVTLVNSEGAWYGGVDRAIYHAAGDYYHNQVRSALDAVGLKHGNVIVAHGNKGPRNHFDHVIFVVDDIEGPVGDLLTLALEKAKERGFKKICIPALRTGVAMGIYKDEPNAETTIHAIAKALDYFVVANPYLEMTINFVVYNDPEIETLLSRAIKR